MKRLKGILNTILVGLICICTYKILDASAAYKKAEKVYEDIRAEKENIEKGSYEIDYEDYRGWIKINYTNINYPVLQGDDNLYYLDKDINGEYLIAGSIFMNATNNGFDDQNMILFGHNMKNGSMFSSLTKYKEQSYYDRYQTMLLYTPIGNFSIELFAGLVLDGNDESVRLDFKDEHDFQNYIELIRVNSTFKSDTVVEADDRIITLCTCSNEFNNARYALYGRLKPILV